MSTRSIIIVTGSDRYNGDCTIRLYKHSDGYPTGNLPGIIDALVKMYELLEEQKLKFNESELGDTSPSALASLIVGETVSVYGVGAMIEDIQYEKFSPKKHLGDQNDLEWIYILNTSKKTLKIYGGGYTGLAPQHAYKKGVVDPELYAECLYENYKMGEISKTRDYIKQIIMLNYKVN